MQLLSQEHIRRLLANGRWNQIKVEQGLPKDDLRPIVKFFCPWSGATWLLTEIDPDEPDIAFGLCDVGLGVPELGNVRLSELSALRGPGGRRIERDCWFRAIKTLTSYADEARMHRRILT
jgi:hypothetical protein